MLISYKNVKALQYTFNCVQNDKYTLVFSTLNIKNCALK